jgi:hypothetical protein
LFSSLAVGRLGRASSSPPQLGHLPAGRASAQVAQKVHSNEQIRARSDSGGRSRSQHSQLGRSSSTVLILGDSGHDGQSNVSNHPSIEKPLSSYPGEPTALPTLRTSSGVSVEVHAVAI